MRPTEARISQPYGQFPQASGQPWIHLGDDYACYRGQDVVTIAAGRVLFAGPGEQVPDRLSDMLLLTRGSTASGRCVITEHDGWWQTFNHLEFYTVNTGDTVRRGQRVGGAGDSGNSTGVHLHHETIEIGGVTNAPPFGRYNPQNQIEHEDRLAAALTPPKPKEPFTVEQMKQIMAKLDRIEAITAENQRRIGRIPKAVWDTPVKRGGKFLSALQDLVNGTTYAEASLKQQLKPADLEALKGTVRVVVSADDPDDAPEAGQ